MIGRQPHGRNGATYVCVDEAVIPYKQKVFEMPLHLVESIRHMETEYLRTMPRNGIWRKYKKRAVVAVSGTVLSRDVAEVFHWNPDKTYTFPSTVVAVRSAAFKNRSQEKRRVSFRLNEGLRTLGDYCFQHSTVTRLVLPPSITSIGDGAFEESALEYVDLRAAHDLKTLGRFAFHKCRKLR